MFRVHGIATSVDDIDDNNAGSDGEGFPSPLVASYTRSLGKKEAKREARRRLRRDREVALQPPALLFILNTELNV